MKQGKGAKPVIRWALYCQTCRQYGVAWPTKAEAEDMASRHRTASKHRVRVVERGR